MEDQEKRMIQDLRATQARQVEAYAHLEETITEPVPRDSSGGRGNNGSARPNAPSQANRRAGRKTPRERRIAFVDK